MRRMHLVAPLALVAVFAAAPLIAAGPQPGTPDATRSTAPSATQAREIVTALASELEQNFVFPDVGQHYAAMLRDNAASGAYASHTSAAALAAAVTADLQAVHADGHLRLMAPDAGAARRAPGAPRPQESAITRTGWLADGVAYIAFSRFDGKPHTLAALTRFLDEHAAARTLVIDARRHRGGGKDEMDVLFPRLFASRTPLVHMDIREAVEAANGPMFEEGPTLTRVSGPAGIVRREHIALPAEAHASLARSKVYLLTSATTASAGEHLALALKRTGRATLIGEATRGAGHFGFRHELPHGFAAFIPAGRTFDPVTGAGWEGTGVQPDIAVPASGALREALRLAGLDESLAAPYESVPASP